MKFEIHEDPLPSNETQAKATVFDFMCHNAFAAWRDCTWRILSGLSHPRQVSNPPLRVEIHNYTELVVSLAPNITLASKTKSLLASHYVSVDFPVPLGKVCIPNGLDYGLFDHSNSIWTAPCESPAALQSMPEFAAGALGPTPNQTVASRTRCPAGATIGEFLAV